MTYDPAKHHRRSIRLKGYDYSQAGLYFITICTQNRAFLFGKIENGEMKLNDAGRVVEKWYYNLENKYPDKRCHEMVVMPNHFHCIIENIATDATITDATITDATITDATITDATITDATITDATITDATITDATITDVTITDVHIGTSQRGRPENNYGMDNKKYNATIGDTMDWFKTMTTNEYIRGVKQLAWQRFDGKLWQRNYWEHIIRNEQSYMKISKYIINNPAKWYNDTLK